MNNLNHIENSSQFQIDILDIGYGMKAVTWSMELV